MNTPKILILDIETAPSTVYCWGLYDQNISLNQIVQEGYMLCWSAKWLGKKEILWDSLIKYPKSFKRDPTNDVNIAKTVWKLMDDADIIIAHNGDNFDIKWLNTIFLKHRMKPTSSFKSIDTLKESRASFKFLSNKLEFITKNLGIGEKMKHEGFSLWTKCMEGEHAAWDKMVKYNKKDVVILEYLYNEIKPYMKRHPNLALYSEEVGTTPTCPSCGGDRFRSKGYAYTQTNKYKRYVCKDCGKNVRGRKSVVTANNNILTNV